MEAHGSYHEGESGQCRFLKLHMLHHFPEQVFWWGVAAVWYGGHWEKALKFFAKRPFERTGGSIAERSERMMERVILTQKVFTRKIELDGLREMLEKQNLHEPLRPGAGDSDQQSLEEDDNGGWGGHGGREQPDLGGALTEEIMASAVVRENLSYRLRNEGEELSRLGSMLPRRVAEAMEYALFEKLREVGTANASSLAKNPQIFTELIIPAANVRFRATPSFRGPSADAWYEFCVATSAESGAAEYVCKLWGFVRVEQEVLACVTWYRMVGHDKQDHLLMIKWEIWSGYEVKFISVKDIRRTAYCLPVLDSKGREVWEIPGVADVVKDGMVPEVGDEETTRPWRH